jgi:hypothetical protein
MDEELQEIVTILSSQSIEFECRTKNPGFGQGFSKTIEREPIFSYVVHYLLRSFFAYRILQ